jgi:hypothetical protein
MKLHVKRSASKKYWWVTLDEKVICTRDTRASAKEEAVKLGKKFNLEVEEVA